MNLLAKLLETVLPTSSSVAPTLPNFPPIARTIIKVGNLQHEHVWTRVTLNDDQLASSVVALEPSAVDGMLEWGTYEVLWHCTCGAEATSEERTIV